MFVFLFLLLTAVVCLPAYAGLSAPPSTPELDAGTLGALTSGITGAYFAFRMYRLKTKK